MHIRGVTMLPFCTSRVDPQKGVPHRQTNYAVFVSDILGPEHKTWDGRAGFSACSLTAVANVPDRWVALPKTYQSVTVWGSGTDAIIQYADGR